MSNLSLHWIWLFQHWKKFRTLYSLPSASRASLASLWEQRSEAGQISSRLLADCRTASRAAFYARTLRRRGSRLSSVWVTPTPILMFIGEAPGADEDAQGEPFVGRAGQLLTKIIADDGLRTRRRLYRERSQMQTGHAEAHRAAIVRRPSTEMQTCLPFLPPDRASFSPRCWSHWVPPRSKACSAFAGPCGICAARWHSFQRDAAHDHLSSFLPAAKSGDRGKAQSLGRHAPGSGAARTTDHAKSNATTFFDRAGRRPNEYSWQTCPREPVAIPG